MSEEISLDGSSSIPHDAAPMPLGTREREAIELSPTMTNEEVLDAYLHTPTEKIIPWEECVLPSGGRYYGWPDGVCQVRAMGQTAEKILATQRLAASGQSLDYLFRECCRFPADFDPADMLVGDRAFLLFYLRGITHGNIYEFQVTCPSETCEHKNLVQFDLNQLVTTRREAPAHLGPEPFRISLPYLSELSKRDFYVELRFLRARDATNIVARRKTKERVISRSGSNVRTRNAAQPPQQQQRQALDTMVDDNLERVIVSVMGVTDQLRIREFIQKLHARDTATIREWLRENTPGIDTSVDVTCSECQSEFAVELPITDSFFRPAKRGRV